MFVMNTFSWYFEKPEHVVTVSTGNTEIPNVFVVVGFDVTGWITSDGQQNAGFVLFNRKNVSWSYTLKGSEQIKNTSYMNSNSNRMKCLEG